MKKFTLYTFLILSLLANLSFAQESDPNNGLKHVMTASEAANKHKIALGFVETNPPSGIIRNVEEFGNNIGVLIRYPFGIPMSLIKEMAKDAKLTTAVANSSQQTTVTNQYISNGVNIANCDFLIAATDSYWTRDYGPWYVTFGNNEVGIIDFPYNRPRPNDDELPKKVADFEGIPWFGMNVIHTGGNYMTNGLNHASSTTLVWDENPTQTADQIALKLQNYLGINNYMVVEDPNNTYIDHIDCWGKFLAPDKVLIRRVPASHPQYADIEATAAFYAAQVSSYGTLYKVFRVNTPNDEPYTNSFILKNKVFVPIMGTINDAAALLSYTQAMPGYMIFGILGNQATPWESTDALHCRTHEIADQGMLMISHTPLHDSIPAQGCFLINADITAFSGEQIYPDSVWTIYKVNSGTWDTLAMSNTNGNQFSACIPGQMEGAMISYFIRASDASDRVSFHPYIGATDAHHFVVKVSAIADAVVTPDSLLFLTNEDMIDGKTTRVFNYTNQEVVVNQINTSGENPFSWYIDPWNITLPYSLQSGDSLNLTVRMSFPAVVSSQVLCDTLVVTTSASMHNVMLYADPDLLTSLGTSHEVQKVSVTPNPMINSTTFTIETEKDAFIQIAIYSALGSLVATPVNQYMSKGTHRIQWNCSDLHGGKAEPGIYLYRVNSGNTVSTGRISIIN